MVESERRTTLRPLRSDGAAKTSLEELPYRVELRGGSTVRLLARARSSALARAIFDTACKEYSDGNIYLCRDARVIAKRLS